MPVLQEGESLEVQGSSGRSYTLKNVAGVFSCTCPAWRNQSLPIDKRTCKHLRTLRGEAAETARLGHALPSKPQNASTVVQAPALLLAEKWNGNSDVRGWWLSEKLDGVRAYWNGKRFLSRLGNPFHAPAWFCAGLPSEPFDGELCLARKAFQRTVSIVRRYEGGDLWKEIQYLVFDAQTVAGNFEQRLRFVQSVMERDRPSYARAHPHTLCQGADHLREELARVQALGGEGLMLRQPDSAYIAGRSPTLLKVKTFCDDEARVVAHEPGSGRHRGRLGALLVETAAGSQFAIGTGLSDADREKPPPVGSIVRFRFQELTDRGIPRFPSYLGVRDEIEFASRHLEEGVAVTTQQAAPQRFEFSEGSSNKFWEISRQSTQVTVRFGRIGTNGQTQTKSFPSDSAANQYNERLIREKLAKGYVAAAR